MIHFVASESLLFIESEQVCLGCGITCFTWIPPTLSTCGGLKGTPGASTCLGLERVDSTACRARCGAPLETERVSLPLGSRSQLTAVSVHSLGPVF